MNGAGVLAVAANRDQSGSQFLLLRPVIMRGELACGHRVSSHGRNTFHVAKRVQDRRSSEGVPPAVTRIWAKPSLPEVELWDWSVIRALACAA